MTLTFSNGYILDPFYVIESKDENRNLIVLSIRLKNIIDVKEVYESIKDGLDEITLEDGEDVIKFTGYNKIAFIQNIFKENGPKESSIGITKEIDDEVNDESEEKKEDQR